MLGYKNRYFEYASTINSGLLVFFRLIFDQEVYFRLLKFYGLVFFRVVFLEFRRSSLSFLPRSTPPPGLYHLGRYHSSIQSQEKFSPASRWQSIVSSSLQFTTALASACLDLSTIKIWFGLVSKGHMWKYPFLHLKTNKSFRSLKKISRAHLIGFVF